MRQVRVLGNMDAGQMGSSFATTKESQGQNIDLGENKVVGCDVDGIMIVEDWRGLMRVRLEGRRIRKLWMLIDLWCVLRGKTPKTSCGSFHWYLYFFISRSCSVDQPITMKMLC